MKERWARFLLAGIFTAFFLVLVSGFSRMVHHEPDPSRWDASMQTNICACTPAESMTHAIKKNESRRFFSESASLPKAECLLHASAAERDANGNILRNSSYTDCVYRAFAPEDGFS